MTTRLDIKAFALTCGLLWGIGLFVLTWWIIAFEGISGDPTFIGRVYPGYALTPLGSVIGIPYAFVDGLIGGAIFAWLYNRLTAHQRKRDNQIPSPPGEGGERSEPGEGPRIDSRRSSQNIAGSCSRAAIPSSSPVSSSARHS